MILEIATTDYTTTKAAVEGGADRIELCAALSDGGTTPSFGTVKKCRENFSLPIFPMIRPRSGDFYYTDEEFEIMLEDIEMCKKLGCDGVVAGLLKKDGSLPLKKLAKLVEAAYPMEFTFHRAFDRCSDPHQALEDLVNIGCTRLLTSGQKMTAPEGAELIAQLVVQADHRIIIMPGSGVRKENIKELATRTGAEEFHTSVRSMRKSSMEFIHPAFAGSDESYSNPNINTEEIMEIRQAFSR